MTTSAAPASVPVDFLREFIERDPEISVADRNWFRAMLGHRKTDPEACIKSTTRGRARTLAPLFG